MTVYWVNVLRHLLEVAPLTGPVRGAVYTNNIIIISKSVHSNTLHLHYQYLKVSTVNSTYCSPNS